MTGGLILALGMLLMASGVFQLLVLVSAGNFENLIEYMDAAFQEIGLKINTNKTKIMTIAKNLYTPSPIKLRDHTFQQVQKFRYLGSLITSDSRCTDDIIARITMAKRAFISKNYLFRSKIAESIKKSLIKIYIWSMALYGCEAWTMKQRDRDRLEACEMWCWRCMKRISWKEKKTNEEVPDMLKEKRIILKTLEERRGKMFGHLFRHDTFLCTLIEGKVEARREKGRPRRAFMDQIKEKVGVVSYIEVKQLAHNREDWRRLHRQEHSS
ncbi:hypothetical protein K1T71_001287 [Dendrolimus kikuchii]|uniref:Uncharacterized protein n=1 Tax=Dendrolimus kikuchii TaxID=765133 RepID=A0ACC1DHE3_9NEOP|nr:hypothetical protein K1T71_001287 [Dendrolimus kikuchii]